MESALRELTYMTRVSGEIVDGPVHYHEWDHDLCRIGVIYILNRVFGL